MKSILKERNRAETEAETKTALICKKAARVFSQKGFNATSLSQISKAARISKGGIYHYFETKEDLLFLVLQRFMDKVLCDLEKKLKPLIHPDEKLRCFITTHIDNYVHNVHESRVMLHEVKNLPSVRWDLMKIKHKRFFEILRGIVSDYFESKGNPMSGESVKIATYALLGMINWIYWWYKPNGPISADHLARKIYEIFVGEFREERNLRS
jgi:AcrR family transcriptional regulator